MSHTLSASGVHMGAQLNESGDLIPPGDVYEACRVLARHVEYRGGLEWDFSRLHTMPIDPAFTRLIESFLASVLGIPFGLMLLKWAPEAIVKGVLGVVLIGFGMYRLITPRLPDLKGSGWLWLSGLISGVLGGAYNTNGPPIVIYATLRRWSPERFRATLQLVWLASGVFIAGGQGLAGLWNPTVFRLIAYALPAVAVGVFLGSRAGRHIPHGVFNRIVYGLLVVMGVFTFV